ncbi:MAG: methylmalonyl Co-A mutase-associated GTPase MeaB [Roseiarcus sp.]
MDILSSSPEVGPALAALVDRLRRSDMRALARCITLTEQGGPVSDLLHRSVYPLTGRASIVGFSGPPGAGKSTLIDAFIGVLRARGRTVAVAAVDPSSPISGGSVLGDRVRMQRHAEDPGVFIRSIASRGRLGGLSESIHRVVDLMDASGRDFVIVETVGAGQSEVEIVEVADVVVVVNAPGLGDDIQAIKAGILEIADILVVNKADLPLAGRTTGQLETMLKLRRERQDVPVIETVATTGAGVAGLAAAVEARAGKTAQEKRTSRTKRVQRLVAQLAGRRVCDAVLALTSAEAAAAFASAREGRISVAEAADQVLRIVLREQLSSPDVASEIGLGGRAAPRTPRSAG